MTPKGVPAVLDSPRSWETDGPGLRVNGQRTSAGGFLIEDPDGDALRTRWLGAKDVVEGGKGRIIWEKIRVDKTVYYPGDFIYVTPEEKGMSYDTVQLLELFDTGHGSSGNRRKMNVRWFWRPAQLDHSGFDGAGEYHPFECFYTDTTSEISTDCIEGYACSCTGLGVGGIGGSHTLRTRARPPS